MIGIEPISAISNTINTIIERIWPDKTEQEKAKLQLAIMEKNGELQEAADQVKLQLAQIDVNKTDAQSEKWWQSGWRPAVGWVGAFSLAYAAILEPLSRFVAQVMFGYLGGFPVIDTTITLQVLFGLLGFGAYRSYEKVRK